MREKYKKIIFNEKFIFIFFALLIFITYRQLFQSYFEADEWYHFTYYFPLTQKPYGFLTAVISTITDAGPLSGGQHVVPLASAVYFLNAKLFGMNYVPYAAVTLLLHTINSFLVFLFIKAILPQENVNKRNIFGILGGIFFALSVTPIHTVTGAAPFYGQNVLSVTFFLACIFSFKQAFLKEKKKLIYLSVVFLFLALFTKETAVFLFFVLPFMAMIEKRTFSKKFLGKIFIFCIVIYTIFRFVVPTLYSGVGQLFDTFVGSYIVKSYPGGEEKSNNFDTGTIVSTDLSIHENLVAEVLFRTVTFPIKMTGTLFVPRETVLSVVKFLSPIVYPVPPGGDANYSAAYLTFLYGPGNGFILFILSLSILIFCIWQIYRNLSQKRIEEARAIATGLAIIVFSALPLVAIVFSFPRWGYDTYFDSRFYYNPNVGAAIIFPFILFATAKLISRVLRKDITSVVVTLIFATWLLNNMQLFYQFTKTNIQEGGFVRREVLSQITSHLPMLPEKAVFYAETDNLSPWGPVLPFHTSIPQALTLAYYDKSPLPESFFNKPIFEFKPQGYMYSEGRGFGYFNSKKDLSQGILEGKFIPEDIYAFYFEWPTVKVSDITPQIRKEMEEYRNSAKMNNNWMKFHDSSYGFSFLYPPETKIETSDKSSLTTYKTISLKNPRFNSQIYMVPVLATFTFQENAQILLNMNGNPIDITTIQQEEFFFDKYHSNKAYKINDGQVKYFFKINDILIYIKTENNTEDGIRQIEQLIGSIEIINEKK